MAAGGAAYVHLSPHPDPAASPILSIFVALALSTYAQSLFGLDLGSGMTRYRLLPLRGWEVLVAKDIPFLGLLLLFTLPLRVAPGLAFGLFALALGHYSSVRFPLPQQRWRFTGGRLLPVGALQAVGGVALGFAEIQYGGVVLAVAALLYAGSFFFGVGRRANGS
jgi:hypothetical protein